MYAMHDLHFSHTPVIVQAIITTTVVLRGRFQTLPVALYGWKIALENGQKDVSAGGDSIVYSANFSLPAPAPRAFAGVIRSMLYVFN